MSNYNQTRDAAGNITSQYGQMLRNLDDDLVKRLRNTPNWMREGFQDWKDNVRTYDRTPFEAADRIEELEAKNKRLNEQMDSIEEMGTESLNALPDCLMRLAPALLENDELKAKLAKAVEHFKKLRRRQDCLETFDAVVDEVVETALAELKGETDE